MNNWVHDHSLSIGQLKGQLEFCRDTIKVAIEQKKSELNRLISVRNSIRK